MVWAWLSNYPFAIYSLKGKTSLYKIIQFFNIIFRSHFFYKSLSLNLSYKKSVLLSYVVGLTHPYF